LEDDIAKDVTLGSRNCGSTALVVMLTDSTVFVANLGDSRAIFVTDNG
jgi:serine/threonine protein phosphatase PrpC